MMEIDRHNGLNYNFGIVKLQLKLYDKHIEVIKNKSQQLKLLFLPIDLNLLKNDIFLYSR